jgi:hypothetical protein
MLMHDIVAFTNISDDPYWCDQAQRLQENLSRFDIDLVVNKQAVSRASDLKSLQAHYHRRDAAFIDFAMQEQRRVLYLDAEVRMHKPLLNKWMDDVTVAFYFYGRHVTSLGKDGLDYEFAINTGQGIWNAAGKSAYARTIDQALENLDTLGFYDEEAFIAANRGPHVKEELCLERRRDHGCAATRGFWVTDKTIFTHPYLHNITYYYQGANTLSVTTITEEFFLAHFSPDDLDFALRILQLLKSRKPDQWSINHLPIEGLTFALSSNPPRLLPSAFIKSDAACYLIKDWIFCPQLMLTSPLDEWKNNAWTIK